MGTDGVARSSQQVGNMYNKNIPAKKNNKVDTVTRKAINTSARDLGIQGPNTIKSSHEPEGEMVDEMKAPRMQKGAMAYDGPNKERSEAADRVLAKTKKKMKKEESDYNYVNSYLSELSKKTMGSYIAKGAKDLADRRFDQGDSEKRKYEPDEEDEKEDKKLDKREQGIARAAKKITKENVEALVSSGFFTAEEVSGILWSEFDESREYSHNPEKYHDSEGRDKKLEMDKPYAKRSRSARMRDPERGINSPAFKKFMADRGMAM